jgi:hypothetical protein
MDANTLLIQLRKERDELSATIHVLEKRVGKAVAKVAKAANPMSEATKAKLRKIMKAKWAAKKKH